MDVESPDQIHSQLILAANQSASVYVASVFSRQEMFLAARSTPKAERGRQVRAYSVLNTACARAWEDFALSLRRLDAVGLHEVSNRLLKVTRLQADLAYENPRTETIGIDQAPGWAFRVVP